VYDAADSTVYVPSTTGQIGLINSATCTAASPAGCPGEPITFAGGDTPQVAALNSSSHTIYIANAGDGSDGSVSVIDTRTCNAQTQTGCASASTLAVPAGSYPIGVDVDSATNTVYVAADSSGGLGAPAFMYVFDGATCDSDTRSGCGQTPVGVPLGSTSPSSVAVDQATNTIYVAAISSFGTATPGEVVVIDGATCNANTSAGCGAPLATLAVGVDPQTVAIDQATDSIYTADQQDTDYQGTVSVLNGATCNDADLGGCDQTAATATVGFGPIGLAVNQAHDQIWVENTQDTSVSVIDGALCNGQHERTCARRWPKLSVTDYPVGAAFADTNHTAYVGGWNGVSILSTTPPPR
jgi:DNA-binding beta-propeller fold protein YncE